MNDLCEQLIDPEQSLLKYASHCKDKFADKGFKRAGIFTITSILKYTMCELYNSFQKLCNTRHLPNA